MEFMPQFIKRSSGYLLLALAIVLAIPVALTLFDLLVIPLSLAIAIHLMSAATGALGFYFITTRDKKQLVRDNIWWVFALVTSATLPFYGIICVISIYAIQGMRGRRPPPVVSDEITVQSPEVFGKPMNRARQLEILDRLDIEPFVDIFRRGQQELKKSAVKFLANIRTRSALRTLNRALMDEDVEIRLYAAGVLGLIDDDYAKEIDTRKNRMIEQPGDIKAVLSLVEIYMAYARSGLIEHISQEYYYGESIRMLGAFPDDPAANYVMARCYYEIEKYDEAREYARRCLESDAENRNCNELLCEILFARRDFVDLEERLQSARNYDPPMMREDVLKVWT